VVVGKGLVRLSLLGLGDRHGTGRGRTAVGAEEMDVGVAAREASSEAEGRQPAMGDSEQPGNDVEDGLTDGSDWNGKIRSELARERAALASCRRCRVPSYLSIGARPTSIRISWPAGPRGQTTDS
jgi:hypothetical protein